MGTDHRLIRVIGRLMRVFMSGELYFFSEEQGKKFSEIQNEFEKKINALLSENDYGCALEDLGIIPTVITGYQTLVTGLKERKLYSLKKKSADYRLFINYDEYAKADDREVERLLVENMIHAIRDLERKIKKGFDGKRLEQDILDVFDLKPEDIREKK